MSNATPKMIQQQPILSNGLVLKQNHEEFPLTVFEKRELVATTSDKQRKEEIVTYVLVETFNKNYDLNLQPEKYNELVNFVISVAEPESRPQYIHEYIITNVSLKAATQVGFTVQTIKDNFCKYSKYEKLPPTLEKMLTDLIKLENQISISLYCVDFYIARLPQQLAAYLHNPAAGDEVAAKLKDILRDDNVNDEYFGYFAETQQRFAKRRIRISRITEFRKIIAQTAINKQDYAVIEEYFLNTVNVVDNVQLEDFKLIQVKTNFVIPNNYAKTLQDNKNNHDPRIDKAIQKCFDYAAMYRQVAPLLTADLKSTTQLRSYQSYAVEKVVSEKQIQKFGQQNIIKKLNSGMIVLPCGSGKSLQGISTACKIGRSCLIITNSNLSNIQWKNQFLQFTTISEKRIYVFQADDNTNLTDKKAHKQLFVPGFHTVFVATYQMLTNSTTNYASVIRQLLKAVTWGIVLFDEAHVMFAKTYSTLFMSDIMSRNKDKSQLEQVDNYIRCYCKLGLTATPLREDDRIKESLHLLGCKLFESNWSDLSKQGYIADLNCVEVQCEIIGYFYEKYLAARQHNSDKLFDRGWFDVQLRNDRNRKPFEEVPQSLYRDQLLRKSNNMKQGGIECCFGQYTQQLIKYNQISLENESTFYNTMSKMISICNPQKLKMASLLKNYHVSQGHQVLLFCDSVIAAEIYSRLLEIPFVKGDVPGDEREVIVEAFLNRQCSCIMMTRVGDTSLDLPDANVLIEVDWQDKSRRQETQRIGRISRPKNSGYQGFFYLLASEATHELESAAERRTYLTINQGYSYSSIVDSDIIKNMDETKVNADSSVERVFGNFDSYYHEILYLAYANKSDKK